MQTYLFITYWSHIYIIILIYVYFSLMDWNVLLVVAIIFDFMIYFRTVVSFDLCVHLQIYECEEVLQTWILIILFKFCIIYDLDYYFMNWGKIFKLDLFFRHSVFYLKIWLRIHYVLISNYRPFSSLKSSIFFII